MPLDAITIKGLCAELSEALVQAKIDKVQQPAKDLLILSLHGPNGSCRLLISAGTGTARVHITQDSFENPQSPPMFCMLLRKHLIGARITGITQPNSERILIFTLDAYDEMGVKCQKELIIELLGRNTNIILTGEQGHIIDCLRRVDGDMSRTRQVMPGLIYRMPVPQDKPNFTDVPVEAFSEIFDSGSDRTMDRLLADSFSGISPLVCRELSFLACGEVSKPACQFTASEREELINQLVLLKKRVEALDFAPSMVIIGDKPSEFSFMPIGQYENAGELKTYNTFSQLLDSFYSRREKQEQMRRKSHSLLKSVRSAHERAQRKLAARMEELERTKNRDEYRKRGDLITANLYRIKKGDRVLVCEDYYTDGSPEIEIPLNPLKTPQQNAALCYRDYTKAKTAAVYLNGLIEQGEREREYLAGVLDSIGRAENEQDLSEIRRELTEQGFIRQQKQGKREKIKEPKPMRFVSSTGTEILVGKNNGQNDALTFKIARRSDIWLHVSKVHGSHVIIRCGDEAPDETTLSEAASLAAYYSQAGESGSRVSVDYTQVRYVKKPSGAMPGSVIFTNQTTVTAQPDRALAEKLRKA